MSFPQSIELDGLVESFSRMNALADLMREASDHVPDRITVEDPTESLRLTMDRGGAIEDLQIDGGWRDEIEPDELGGALTALIGEARTRLYEDADAYIAEHADEFEERADGGAQLSAASAEIQARADELSRRSADQGQVLMEQVLSGLSDLFDRADRVLADFDEAGVPGASEEEDEFADGEAFICEESGGIIRRVSINPTWARVTPTVRIRNELVEVLTSCEADAFDGDSDSFLGDAEQSVVDLLGILNSLS